MIFVIGTAPAPFLSFFLWRCREKWQYILKRQFRLIDWNRGNRVWKWHNLTWSGEVVSGVEEGEWRGLPALYVRTAAKNPKDNRKFVMVNAHEDREKVVDVVLPLIQHYRWRSRNIAKPTSAQ